MIDKRSPPLLPIESPSTATKNLWIIEIETKNFSLVEPLWGEIATIEVLHHVEVNDFDCIDIVPDLAVLR